MVQVIDYDEQGNIRTTRIFNGQIKEERIYRNEDIEVISEGEFGIPVRGLIFKIQTKVKLKTFLIPLLKRSY
ncbi:hypothetical protein [Bacillus sp. B1-b2]|uniref:hypothetical protein n=1 Tax=Bacillus sp. B1-b2 TaxID=2653201 RepID=UPI001261CCBB|nr:hypothetical protein [Bacillus sp. B1-b2]KAB7668919.1 hypothetical protein F9279_11995 [Bacillus sp. B1-b2]